MNDSVKRWIRHILTVAGLTILILFSCLSIDASYLNNPIGYQEIGIVSSDGIPLPATNEVSVVADGIDPIQIDIKSSSGDFAGQIMVSDPEGRNVFQKDYALKYYPNTLFPNPTKWKTFMVPYKKPGVYRVFLSQDMFGKAQIYIYQGPFWARMLFLPLFATLIYIIVSVTFTKKSAKPTSASKPVTPAEGVDPSKRQSETVLDCAPKAIGDSSNTEVVCTDSKDKVQQ
ncbi:MAG: hypothetical protein PHF29_01650 [Candidatus Riflebacteria bacterium]|nr:hypothetical protein [Candidatus Riflebacteria bacterium]